MTYYCSVCDRTIEHKPKNKHFASLTHKDYDNIIRINHIIQNSNFFDADKKFNDNVIIHKKN